MLIKFCHEPSHPLLALNPDDVLMLMLPQIPFFIVLVLLVYLVPVIVIFNLCARLSFKLMSSPIHPLLNLLFQVSLDGLLHELSIQQFQVFCSTFFKVLFWIVFYYVPTCGQNITVRLLEASVSLQMWLQRVVIIDIFILI